MERRKGRSVDRNRDTFRARERERTTKTDRSPELPQVLSSLIPAPPLIIPLSLHGLACSSLTREGEGKRKGQRGKSTKESF